MDKDIGMKLLGVVFLVVGVVGALGFLGELNPLSFISDPLFSFTMLFLSESASLILYGALVLLGFVLAAPEGGYIKTITGRR